MKTAILVLGSSGLALARRCREARPEGTVIFGPSCVVGRCGGSEESAPTFATDEPTLRGWVGPLRKVLPALWEEFDAIVGVMPLAILVKLVGPLALDPRRNPAVVAIDDAGRFAISVLDGRGGKADALAIAMAGVLGATSVITTAHSRCFPVKETACDANRGRSPSFNPFPED